MTAPKAVALMPVEDLLQSRVEADMRFTLHRVVYDLYSAVFPARVRALVVCVIFCGGVGEYQARLALTDPDGIAVADAPFTFSAKTYHVQAINLTGTMLPEAGQYWLNLELEGQPVLMAPLVVAKLGAAPAAVQNQVAGA